MRIAVNGRFCAARPTGVQRVARELVSRLPGWADVTLHLPRRAPAAEWRPPVRTRPGRLRGPLWEQLELPWRRGRDGYDVALDPANAGPRTGQRRVLLLHDVFPLTHPSWYGPAFRRWFSAAVAPSARRAARVVMFTRWARDQAVDALGLDPARVMVLGQGVEPFDAPVSDEEERRALERFGLLPGFILAAGGGDRRKNTAFLERVAARLDGLPVVVVGARYAHVQSTAAPGGERRVRHLGHVTEVELRALYRAACVFCFPSLGEGFGRPPLEAMASGTPVIAAGYGCAAEVLGDAAALPPLQPQAWADAIETLAREGPERRRAIEAGRRRAARYRWDAAAEALARVCREVADGATPARRGGTP